MGPCWPATGTVCEKLSDGDSSSVKTRHAVCGREDQNAGRLDDAYRVLNTEAFVW